MKKTSIILVNLLIISQLSFPQSVTLVPTNPASPTKGTMNYDVVNNVLQYWNGSAWIPITHAASGTGWALSGNDIYSSNTGNVGIGTTSPLDKLSISTANGIYGFSHTNGTVTTGSQLSASTALYGTKTNHPLQFMTNGTSQMTIYANGKIGIGASLSSNPSNYFTLTPTADSVLFYLKHSGKPTIYGSMRLEYTGSTDHNRVGILSTTIRSISDVNGIGIEGAGNSIGVQGLAETNATSSTVTGTEGDSYGSGNYSIGVGGYADKYSTVPTYCYGVYGKASGGTTNFAMYADGNMKVVGTLTKASGTFEIDHPLDPANKYLYHSFVESPDMMNIYNGNATTDATGTATISLPSYFEALNKDFRYQLTVIGTFAQAIVSKEVSGNSFEIKTNQPNVKVSWQVTGVRQDAWANAHRVVVEVDKTVAEKGKYLHPDELGLTKNMRVADVNDLRIGGDMKRNQNNEKVISSEK